MDKQAEKRLRNMWLATDYSYLEITRALWELTHTYGLCDVAALGILDRAVVMAPKRMWNLEYAVGELVRWS